MHASVAARVDQHARCANRVVQQPELRCLAADALEQQLRVFRHRCLLVLWRAAAVVAEPAQRPAHKACIALHHSHTCSRHPMLNGEAKRRMASSHELGDRKQHHHIKGFPISKDHLDTLQERWSAHGSCMSNMAAAPLTRRDHNSVTPGVFLTCISAEAAPCARSTCCTCSPSS